MELYEWLFRKKITRKKLAEALGVSYCVIQYSVAQDRKISIDNALKIVAFTNNEVPLTDLIAPHVMEEIKKIKPYNHKENEENHENIFNKDRSIDDDSYSTTNSGDKTFVPRLV
jgi:transcriptional regulator with XRE-family HTH domain